MVFCRPVNNSKPKITTNFSTTHPGKDYAEPDGTPVYAQQEGTIRIIQGNETRQWIANGSNDPFKNQRVNGGLLTADYGNCIIVNHAEGFQTLYAHLKHGSFLIKEGQFVRKGQKIAEVGSTGNSTGNHVHNELRLNGNKVDLTFFFDPNFTGYFTPEEQVPIETSQQIIERLRRELNDLDKQKKEWENRALALDQKYTALKTAWNQGKELFNSVQI